MYKKTQMKTSFLTAVILTLFIISSTVAQEMVEKVRGLQFAERIVAGGPDDEGNIESFGLAQDRY